MTYCRETIDGAALMSPMRVSSNSTALCSSSFLYRDTMLDSALLSRSKMRLKKRSLNFLNLEQRRKRTKVRTQPSSVHRDAGLNFVILVFPVVVTPLSTQVLNAANNMLHHLIKTQKKKCFFFVCFVFLTNYCCRKGSKNVRGHLPCRESLHWWCWGLCWSSWCWWTPK